MLDAMTDAMRHRGPDDRGTFVAPGVALGARRLSIVDVEGGHQPFASEDERVWAVQNGELYNHEASGPSWARAAIASAAAATPRSCRTCTSVTVPGARAAARQVRDRGLGRPRAPRVARTRPPRREAALLGADRRPGRVRLRAEEHPRKRAARATPRLRGDRRLPHARLRPRARHPAGRESASCSPATASSIDPGGVRERALLALPRTRARRPSPLRSRLRRRTARPPARGRPSPADERRPPRRDALRRPRLQPDRRTDGRTARRAPSRPSPSASAKTQTTASSPTPAPSPPASQPTTTSSSSPTPTTPSSSPSSSGTSTNPSPTSPHSASSHSPTSPANTSPSPSAAKAPTNSSAATESTGSPRSSEGSTAFR